MASNVFQEINMECFDVCLTMPISKTTSVLNAKIFFYHTLCFKHVLRKKCVLVVLLSSH